MYDIITTTIECAPSLSRSGVAKLAADVTGKRGLRYDIMAIEWQGGQSRYAATLIGRHEQSSDLADAKTEFLARLDEAGQDPNTFGYILEEHAADAAKTAAGLTLAGFLAWKGTPILIAALVAWAAGLDIKKLLRW